jgi:hypothetical protein
MVVAELALAKRPPLIVGVSGERASAGAAAADGAVCRVPAGEQFNLLGHSESNQPSMKRKGGPAIDPPWP